MPPSKEATSTTRDKQHTSNTAAGELLLERLRVLLTRLNEAYDICQNWPESDGDSAKIHAETATKLIQSIAKITRSVRSVERHVNGTGPPHNNNPNSAEGAISKESLESFRISLDEKCPIPLDLLDLLDVGNPFGMNPQCYARGLMKEALRQLAGLERRKRALDMLGTAIERGLEDRMNADSRKGEVKEVEVEDGSTLKKEETEICSKRKREDGANDADEAKKSRLTSELKANPIGQRQTI
mmetsp:Transcript_5513/g.11394  ORF Transcript_5513/g.11394 Transcript_5513/m.11394 type:complete len:241 (+) Transcript_5513:171-893(+)